MLSASGIVYKDGKFIEGSARASKGKIVINECQDAQAEVKGWILPKTVNCHTHIGDGFISRPEKCTVEELVAPPDGLKHRMLRTVSEKQQVSCMRESISTMAGTGTSHFIDFRESGLEGIRRLLMASLGSGVIPIILGRPESSDANEISAILSVADGMGVSAISDSDYEGLLGLSEHASATEKIFCLHASEVNREDIDKIIALRPNMLVHMVEATEGDLRTCSSAGIPIIICPSSNAYFGFKPPLRVMLDAGVTVCLGSDNAMLAQPDILNEVRVLRDMFPESMITDDEILEMAFVNGRKVLNSLPGLGDANVTQPDFFVYEAPIDEPFMSILQKGTGKFRMFETGGIP
ncbi:MAG: amidohydrolase family protein [Thermoplasmata archaeon]